MSWLLMYFVGFTLFGLIVGFWDMTENTDIIFVIIFWPLSAIIIAGVALVALPVFLGKLLRKAIG